MSLMSNIILVFNDEIIKYTNIFFLIIVQLKIIKIIFIIITLSLETIKMLLFELS